MYIPEKSKPKSSLDKNLDFFPKKRMLNDSFFFVWKLQIITANDNDDDDGNKITG